MKTLNRPNASTQTRAHIAAMERQVRRLFNCEPNVSQARRQELFEQLVELDARLERLSLRSLGPTADATLFDELSLCERDFARLESNWMSGKPSHAPTALVAPL